MAVHSGARLSRASHKAAPKATKTSAANRSSRKEVFAHPTLGFGVPTTSDPHHFKVVVPKGNSGQVQISEYLGLQASSDEFSLTERVGLERERWRAIRGEVQRAFNVRLKAHKLKSSSWKVGENRVDRLLGKELCVLAWAVENMEMKHIPVAIANWLALRPEERWWLFGMTAMSAGGIDDGGRGWRLALCHALGDAAQDKLLQPHARREIIRRDTLPTLDLFGEQ